MTLRSLAAGAALAAAALCALPAAAHADDPEFPRNGIVPPGAYHIPRGAANVVGTPLDGCVLHVDGNTTNVFLDCPAFDRAGRQIARGPNETDIVLDGVPLGLSLHDIDPRQGIWTGTPNVGGFQIPEPLAGLGLQRR
ncbi:hypothetical protein [Nocardia higoensis]|uniref:hypothetical protein n=1 Tax=Nocardia higoensis TaxID=228599 RepID=UPI0002EF3BDC|nr:hypothetical protein [Nocardia higoensis]